MLKTEKRCGEGGILRPVMPELNAVRGVAILMVFLFHAFEDFNPAASNVPAWEHLFLSTVSLGWIGVNLFFVLSGFLITGILLDSANRPRYYSRFYSRRALRILPAYYLLIVVLVLLSRISFVTRRTSWAFAGLSVFYLSNITPLLGVPRDYAPLWSLAVEEHFYLVWPAAVRFFKGGGLLIAAALICISEPVLRVFATARGGLWWGPYTWLSADGLALGALLALFARSTRGSRVNILRLAGLSALVGIVTLAATVAVPRYMAISLRATCVNYIALGFLAAVLWLGTGPYKGLVNLKILLFFGFISYGFYLIHALIFSLYNNVSVKFWPFFTVGDSFGKCLLRLLVALIIATAVAYISRITCEEFFLRIKDKPDKQVNPQLVQFTEPLLPT